MGLSKKSPLHQGLLSPLPVAVFFLSLGMVALGHWILGNAQIRLSSGKNPHSLGPSDPTVPSSQAVGVLQSWEKNLAGTVAG